MQQQQQPAELTGANSNQQESSTPLRGKTQGDRTQVDMHALLVVASLPAGSVSSLIPAELLKTAPQTPDPNCASPDCNSRVRTPQLCSSPHKLACQVQEGLLVVVV
jgi:hypothetical protein